MIVEGHVTFADIGPGCWGLKDKEGNIWRIVDLPERYRKEGRKLRIKVSKMKEDVSLFMWGTPVSFVEAL